MEIKIKSEIEDDKKIGLDKEKVKKAFQEMIDDEECKTVIFQTNCGGVVSGSALDILTSLDMIITKLAEDIPCEVIEKSVNTALAVAKARETGDFTSVLEVMKNYLKAKENK